MLLPSNKHMTVVHGFTGFLPDFKESLQHSVTDAARSWQQAGYELTGDTDGAGYVKNTRAYEAALHEARERDAARKQTATVLGAIGLVGLLVYFVGRGKR